MLCCCMGPHWEWNAWPWLSGSYHCYTDIGSVDNETLLVSCHRDGTLILIIL